MNKVLVLGTNFKGRDIVVGDIHGSFVLLKKALKAINFNPQNDRLICTGDLVDRGSNSVAAKDWINTNYFFSVMGNHDAQYAFYNSYDLFKKSIICSPIDLWYTKITKEEFKLITELFRKKLYPAIEVMTKNGKKVGIVHGEVPIEYNWTSFKNELNNNNYELFRSSIWNRFIAKKAIINNIPQSERFNELDDYEKADRIELPDKIEIIDETFYLLDDVAYVFHGHTVSNKLKQKPYSIANRYYIDTNAYNGIKPKYPNAGITLFDIENPNKPLIFLKD